VQVDAEMAAGHSSSLNGGHARRVEGRSPSVSAVTSTSARSEFPPLARDGALEEDELALRGPERVTIELSPAQVDRVVRGAAEGGNMSVLLSGLKDVREVLSQEPRQMEDSRLSRSLLAGLLMLACFPTDGTFLGNAEIARMLDMNPSTTHRYVSTLVAVGLIERDPATRRYRLV
jgi:hypothetical protein